MSDTRTCKTITTIKLLTISITSLSICFVVETFKVHSLSKHQGPHDEPSLGCTWHCQDGPSCRAGASCPWTTAPCFLSPWQPPFYSASVSVLFLPEGTCTHRKVREKAPLGVWSLHNPSSTSPPCRSLGHVCTCAWHIVQAVGAKIQTKWSARSSKKLVENTHSTWISKIFPTKWTHI